MPFSSQPLAGQAGDQGRLVVTQEGAVAVEFSGGRQPAAGIIAPASRLALA